MAVYLFTFHAYGSWMPDRGRGYVRRGEGILPPDAERAARYRSLAKHEPMSFGEREQAVLVAAARVLCESKNWRLHQVATDPTHVHTLVSWREFWEWKRVMRAMKYRYTSALNGEFGKGVTWFSQGGSRRRVGDREHFDYLMKVYLPRHRGAGWREDLKTGDQNRRL